MSDTAIDLKETIGELVDANRILADQRVVDGFGHVSARHPNDPNQFLISRSMAPARVRAGDILALDLDGEPVLPGAPKIYLERFIHSEIYRARPDVMAVVHSHSPSVVPFTVVPEAPLRTVCHMCGFIGDRAPVFEIRDVAGPATDLLIRDRSLGRALAGSLDRNAVVLMRGHGSTVVGISLRQAVFRAVYLELGARLQADASRLGTVVYLTAEEAAAASHTNDGQIGRAWDLWRDALQGD